MMRKMEIESNRAGLKRARKEATRKKKKRVCTEFYISSFLLLLCIPSSPSSHWYSNFGLKLASADEPFYDYDDNIIDEVSPSEDVDFLNKNNNDDDDDVDNYLDLMMVQSEELSDDDVEDSMFDPFSRDPSCSQVDGGVGSSRSSSCWSPPASTVEEEVIRRSQTTTTTTTTCTESSESGSESDSSSSKQCVETESEELSEVDVVVDKHWGSDPNTLRMRDKLREMGTGTRLERNHRPPIFLLPGLASTRLVAWKYKACSSALLSDIKVQDNVWVNLNTMLSIGTIGNASCWLDCLTLGYNQTDSNDVETGCKLRPDEGLDAIASLAPGGIQSELMIGGTNTVYAWLIQWLADNLGYDVSNIIGLPYDWRLSPDRTESRDGFLTLTRRRIEAAVQFSGEPGILVAHSMGNVIFRYFLIWLRKQMREEAYTKYIRQAEKRAKAQQKKNDFLVATAAIIQKNHHQYQQKQQQQQQYPHQQQSKQQYHQHQQQQQLGGPMGGNSATGPTPTKWMDGVISGLDEWWNAYLSSSSSTDDQAGSSSSSSSTASNSDSSTTTEDNSKIDGDANTINDDDNNNNDNDSTDNSNGNNKNNNKRQYPKLWELAKLEGDDNWIEWLENHIWTYVGLSAPMLGAVNTVRAVLSGENMGLPITDEAARVMEGSFGSTNTINPLSSTGGFCDSWDVDEWDNDDDDKQKKTSAGENTNEINPDDDEELLSHGTTKLACLDDLWYEIELYNSKKYSKNNVYNSNDEDDTNNNSTNPWKDFPTLEALLKHRVDYDTDYPMVEILIEQTIEEQKRRMNDSSGGSSSGDNTYFENVKMGPQDVQTGKIFEYFDSTWNEEGRPMKVKLEQLRESFWDTGIPNPLNRTWERPLIKHIIMAYGVDLTTEVGYAYKKRASQGNKEGASDKDSKIVSYDGVPELIKIIREKSNGEIAQERLDSKPGGLFVGKKKVKKEESLGRGTLRHSGDGSVPYLSLSWAHTWLLHSARALRHDTVNNKDNNNEEYNNIFKNPLDDIDISHRPKGATEWSKGAPPDMHNNKYSGSTDTDSSSDTGTNHPHGTKYKPEMVRYHNVGESRTTGMEYTTTVIEAIGVEHKETTRNFDILAAVFTDVLKNMHDDFGLV